MKFWLFDGSDVAGPFSPQELAARADFSATSLICAENASEDSAGWQMAQLFDAFRFNASTGKVEAVFPAQEGMLTSRNLPQVTPAPAPAPEEKPQDAVKEDTWVPPAKVPQPTATVEPEAKKPTSKKKKSNAQEKAAAAMKAAREVSRVRLSRSKNLTQPPAPVALAREDVELVLPQKETPAQGKKAVQEKPKVQPEQPPAQTPAAQAQTPEEEILSTCTLPVVNEVLAQSDLPSLPEKGFQPVALPAEPEFDLQEIEQPTVLPPTPAPQPAQAAVQNEEPEDLTVTQKTASKETPTEEKSATEEEEAAKLLATFSHHNLPKSASQYPAPERPKQRTISEIEKAFAPAPEQEEFLLEQQLLSPTRKKARLVLGILFLLTVVGAAALWNMVASNRANAPQPGSAQDAAAQEELLQPSLTTVTQAVKPILLEKAAPVAAPSVKSVAAPAPATAADKALAIVQNHRLPGNKGTVAAYFDRIYASHLAQGYTANWSVEPLHKNTYIVKYRLTKTRMEPIVYVFQADAVRGKLTGALNNVALDLVGKI